LIWINGPDFQRAFKSYKRQAHRLGRRPFRSSDHTLEVGSLIQGQEPTVCGIQPVMDEFG
jgi:hypothetical protein